MQRNKTVQRPLSRYQVVVPFILHMPSTVNHLSSPAEQLSSLCDVLLCASEIQVPQIFLPLSLSRRNKHFNL